jgi:hypothetical protein
MLSPRPEQRAHCRRYVQSLFMVSFKAADQSYFKQFNIMDSNVLSVGNQHLLCPVFGGRSRWQP